MSEDIRMMIDKVKNFNQFVNENENSFKLNLNYKNLSKVIERISKKDITLTNKPILKKLIFVSINLPFYVLKNLV